MDRDLNQTETPASPAMPLIFVTGASRSGTTMLARMLGSHSAVMAFDELHYFGDQWNPNDSAGKPSADDLANIAATLLARQNRGLWAGRTTDQERAWGRSLLDRLPERDRSFAGIFAAALGQQARDAGKRFACEQTPRNIFYAERLLELYPDARIVHIVRDPRAVLASQKNRWQLRRLGAEHLPMSEMLRNWVNYHPVTMAKLWTKATEQAVKLCGHSRFTIVRFEDLAADAESRTRGLCDFLGLNYEPAMLEIPRWGSSNVTHDSGKKGVSSEVVGKWRDNLGEGEIIICETICRQMMNKLTYEIEKKGLTSRLSALPSLLAYPLHVAGVVLLNPVRAWIQLRALLGAR